MVNKKFALAVLFFIAVLALLVSFFFSSKQIKPPAAVVPQPIQNSLHKTKSYPEDGVVEIGDTQNAISIFFDQPVNVSTVVVTVFPLFSLTPTTRKDDPRRLILAPTALWKPDASYVVRVSRGIMSIDGLYKLDEDIILQYKTTKPKPRTEPLPFPD